MPCCLMHWAAACRAAARPLAVAWPAWLETQPASSRVPARAAAVYVAFLIWTSRIVRDQQ